MSASDAAPLPRLGEVYFDVRGDSRSMRLSWYADTGVAVFSIWQGGTCTGTFRLPIADLPRMVAALQRGPGADGEEPPAEPRPPQDGRAGPGRGARQARAEGDIQTGQHTAAFRPPDAAADPATGPGMDAAGYREDPEAFPPSQLGRHRDGPDAGYPDAGPPGGYPDDGYPDGAPGGYHDADGPAGMPDRPDPLGAPGGRRSGRSRRRYPEAVPEAGSGQEPWGGYRQGGPGGGYEPGPGYSPESYEDDLSGRHAGEPAADFGEDPLGGYREDPPRAFDDGPAGRHGGPPTARFGDDPLGGYRDAPPEPYEGDPYGRHGGRSTSGFGEEPPGGYHDDAPGGYRDGGYRDGTPGGYGPGDGLPGGYGPGDGPTDGYRPEPATDDYPTGLAVPRFGNEEGDPLFGDPPEPGSGASAAHEYRDESPVRPYVAGPRRGGEGPGPGPAVRGRRRARARQPEEPSPESFPYGPPPGERQPRQRDRYEGGH